MSASAETPGTPSGGASLLSRPLDGRFLLASGAAVYVAHVALWAATGLAGGQGVSLVGRAWDGGWYAGIAENGYNEQGAAFFPLLPATLGAIHRVLPVFPGLVGAALSTLAFAALLLVLSREVDAPEPRVPSWALPADRFSWLCFLLWPASWVLGTCHTEAIFLLLSWGAFTQAARGRLAVSSVLAGLCALTRPPGFLVGVAVGVLLARRDGSLRERATLFVLSGLTSASFAALYPAYLQVRFGNPRQFLDSQSYWSQALTPLEALRTLVFLNPQPVNLGKVVHYLFALGCIALIVRARRHLPAEVFGYVVACFALMCFQGHFNNAYRYTLVLFPLLFSLGRIVPETSPRVRCVMLGVLLFLNTSVTGQVAFGRWGY